MTRIVKDIGAVLLGVFLGVVAASLVRGCVPEADPAPVPADEPEPPRKTCNPSWDGYYGSCGYQEEEA